MKVANSDTDTPLIVGIDWADSKHDLTILDRGRYKHTRIDANPQDVEEIITQLQEMAGERRIAICLEKGRVRIIYHLMLRDNIQLYPIDPKQVARYRDTFRSSGSKDDAGDSYYLARLLAERRQDLAPMKPDDQLTRRISLLCQTRRSLVNDKTSVIQQLYAKVKMIHPVVLMLPVKKLDSGLTREFLRRFTDPRKAKKAHPETLRKMLRRHGISDPDRAAPLIALIRSTPLVTTDSALIDPLVIHMKALIEQLGKLEAGVESCEKEIEKAMAKHPDAQLFRSLPGAGAALAPRLLSAFGSDRKRFANADAISSSVGIAPVTKQSGKMRRVTRRRACPKFLLQTFHEFAGCARRFCPWSRAYYRWQRSKGVGHHAALRKLATRWVRILFRVWQTGQPYDADRYITSMKSKNHPLVAFLPLSENQAQPS